MYCAVGDRQVPIVHGADVTSCTPRLRGKPEQHGSPTLLDYHRLRGEEERSWDRGRLRQGSGSAFAEAAEQLLPGTKKNGLPDKLIHFARIADLIGGDVGDALIGLSLLCHGAKLAGADGPALFREVAALAGPTMRGLSEGARRGAKWHPGAAGGFGNER